MDKQLTHFSLFTGIGGIDLAAEWAGFKTVGQCEWADYPTKVLEKHWPNVPRWRDIRSVTKESMQSRGIGTIKLISGGFPCQPFSLAGEREGEDDDRFLWPEMCRVIQEVQSDWVIGENVLGLVSLALDQVLSDLENLNYACQPFIVPACAVNAPHRRDRVFIVGHLSNSGGFRYQGIERLFENFGANTEWGKSTYGATPKLFDDIDWKKRAAESGFLGANDGVSNRLDRIKCCGNAVSPYQIYPILKAIADIDTGNYE